MSSSLVGDILRALLKIGSRKVLIRNVLTTVKTINVAKKNFITDNLRSQPEFQAISLGNHNQSFLFEQIMDLKELFTDPMFLDLVEDYVISLPEKIEQLRAATRQSDWETVKTISHQLKGSGGGYGFSEVSNAAAAIEMLCESAKPDCKTIEGKIEALSEACLTARELLENHRHLI